ncbi:MAG: glycoside hydrolase family 16 protein [Opitutaceae bacterium]
MRARLHQSAKFASGSLLTAAQMLLYVLSTPLLSLCANGESSGVGVDPTSDPNARPYGVSAPSGYRYQMIFSDEFNGTAVDETKWDYRIGSKNVSTIQPENNRVSGGLFRIDLKKERNEENDTDYTCGGIISKGFVRYGYYETSLKIPAGGGWHTSFWMMNNTSFPRLELDPFENDSVFQNKYTVDAHDWTSGNQQVRLGTDPINTTDLSDNFHIIGMLFTATELKFYMDGNLVHSYDATLLAHRDVNIWMTSLGFVNGYNTFAIDDSQLPAEAQFEYVRHYELVTHWDHFVTLNNLDGGQSDTDDADSDGVSDWKEYLTGGDPMDPADRGVAPILNIPGGEFHFSLRNDPRLEAYVQTRSSLSTGDWATHKTINVSVNDGALNNYTSSIPADDDQHFVMRGSILGTVLLANDLQELEKSTLKTQMIIFLATLAGSLNRKQSR